MKRQTATIVVVALVVVSGCNFVVDSGSETSGPEPVPDTPTPEPNMETPTATATATATSTATAAATPTATDAPTATAAPGDGTPTPAPDLDPVSAVDAPPGLDGNELANPGQLVGAHRQRLAGASYETDLLIVNTSRDNATLHVRNGTQAVLVSLEAQDGQFNNDYYLSSTEAGVRNQTADRVKYGNGPTSVQFEAGFLVGFFGAFGPQFAGAAEWHAVGSQTVDGEDQVVFTAEDLVASDETDLNIVSPDENARDVEGRMVVSSDGLIRSIELTWTTERADGTTYREGIEYSLSNVGEVTVDRPTWLEGAPQLEASVTDSDRLFVLDHTNGPALDAGTNVTFSSFFGPGTNVTLDQQVGEGDTIYVYKTGSGTDVSYEASVNSRPSLPDDATAFSGTVIASTAQGKYVTEAGVEVASE